MYYGFSLFESLDLETRILFRSEDECVTFNSVH